MGSEMILATPLSLNPYRKSFQTGGNFRAPAISPDGSIVAYVIAPLKEQVCTSPLLQI
ncbi:MAG: hypothetical protein CM1200mP35_05510 [Chloroflexota bacterium]|nr:MAG: hypothetical protein CM1200mP35_05510 [Chloroflexota bacterium]